jgi:hypothetical protein
MAQAQVQAQAARYIVGVLEVIVEAEAEIGLEVEIEFAVMVWRMRMSSLRRNQIDFFLLDLVLIIQVPAATHHPRLPVVFGPVISPTDYHKGPLTYSVLGDWLRLVKCMI